MFIALSLGTQRGSEGGMNLESYLPSLVPPSEPRRRSWAVEAINMSPLRGGTRVVRVLQSFVYTFSKSASGHDRSK